MSLLSADKGRGDVQLSISQSPAEEQEGGRGSAEGVPGGTRPAFPPNRVPCHYYFSKWMEKACRVLGFTAVVFPHCLYLPWQLGKY